MQMACVSQLRVLADIRRTWHANDMTCIGVLTQSITVLSHGGSVFCFWLDYLRYDKAAWRTAKSVLCPSTLFLEFHGLLVFFQVFCEFFFGLLVFFPSFCEFFFVSFWCPFGVFLML